MNPKITASKFALFVTLIFAFNIFAAETFNIIPSKSTLEWKARKVTGQHNGTVDIKSGRVVVDGESVKSGSFEIDMNTIVDLDLKNEGMNAKLVGHLKSDDFFSVAIHPVSIFKIKSVDMGTDVSTVKGDLTIKGITHEIEIPAEIKKVENGYHVTAEFSIDRSKWEIKFRSAKFFPNLGDKLIYDDINYKLDLVFEK